MTMKLFDGSSMHHQGANLLFSSHPLIFFYVMGKIKIASYTVANGISLYDMITYIPKLSKQLSNDS